MLLSLVCVVSAMAQKPKVAVYITGDDPINELVGSSLEDGLAHNGKYTAVERTASFLNAIGREHSYERSGAVDDDQIARLGRQFSVQYVCVASVSTVWDNEKYISARIIDVESAEVVATGSSNGSVSTTERLVNALDALSESLLKALDYSKTAGAKKVAVYVTKSDNRDVDIILGDQLVAGFANSGKYLAIERTNRFLSELAKEHGYQQSGAVADEDLARLGKQAGVQYVCVAKTTNWSGDYFISSRLIDVQHADIANSSNEKGIKLNNSNDVVNISTKIAGKLSGRTIEEELAFTKRNEELKKQGLVDLGLPSGTLWEIKDEDGLYDWNDAIRLFGNRMPTYEQIYELRKKCSWKESGDCFIGTGPNGNTITLCIRGTVGLLGTVCKGCGFIWSRTQYINPNSGRSDDRFAYALYFEQNINIAWDGWTNFQSVHTRCSVRLVKNK